MSGGLFPVPDERAHPKQELHDAVQASLLPLAGLEHAVATRWILTVEVAMQESQLALVTISGTPSLSDLRSWEQVGMLASATARFLRAQP